MNSFEKFARLHQQPNPFLLGNIWDVNSAVLFENAGYKAIGTSSQALAIANGYDDGEQVPFDLLVRLAKKVVEKVTIPFSVDIEAGYARSIEGIVENISRLHDAGIAGINLEDTIPGATRELQQVDKFREILSNAADYISRNNLNLFINVRTDGFLLGLPNALEETITRIKSYDNTGASGIFTPCITAESDIKAVVESTKLPINVMCMPDLPGFDELATLGVKRISMGGFFFFKINDEITKMAKTVSNSGSFKPLFS